MKAQNRITPLTAGLLIGAAASAQTVLNSVGDDLWIDGPAIVEPGTNQTYPDVAVDNDRRSIFVWEADFASGGDSWDIFARQFDVDGNPLQDPIFVNSYTSDAQNQPRVAVAANDSFLVIWQSSEYDADVGVNRFWVRSQAFDSTGSPVGSEALLSTLSSGEATDVNADVAALRGGGYVVAWRSRNSTGTDSSFNIQARRVSAAGVPQGSQFQVNSATNQAEKEPAVVELADGGFLVVWINPEVSGRRFDASGSAVGGDFQINTNAAGGESDPDAVLGWDGRVLVVWRDDEGIAKSGEIDGRLFDADLGALGDDFRINTLTDGLQDNVRAGDYGPLGFLVAWQSATTNGNDANPASIQSRIVTGDDSFLADQSQLNTFTTGTQETPGVGGWYGRAAVAWRSAGNSETPGDVITGDLWEDCLFCDDLEWGSTWRWSSTVSP